MSASPQEKRRSATWRYVLYATVLVSMLLAAPMEAMVSIEAVLLIGFHLAIGWVTFIAQSSRLAVLDGALLASFFIGLGVVVACAHAMMKHLMRQRPANGRGWQWKWTLSLVAMPLILFGICVSTQGAVTTSGWLFSSPLDKGYSRGLNKSYAGRLAGSGRFVAEETGQERLPSSIFLISGYREESAEHRKRVYIYRDPEIKDVPEYWTWLGGVKVNSPDDVLVAFAPRPTRNGTRVVSFVDGTAKECTEQEWQAALERWRRVKEGMEREDHTDAK